MRALVTAGLLLLVGGCDLPRDPEQTFERVRGGTLRVGITARPPWTSFDAELQRPAATGC